MKILLSFILFSSWAQANVWDGDIDFQQDYACLGIDGIPIGNTSALAATCCNGHDLVANPPPNCKAGFQTITTDAGNGAAGGINIATNTLHASGQMPGNNSDTSTTPPNLGSSVPAGPNSEGSAISSGTGGFTPSSGVGVGNAGAGNGSGTGGGKPGSGAGGSGPGGFALGTAGGTSAAKNGDGTDANGDKANGGYVKGGDAKGAGNGGTNPFGGFGGAGGANAGVGADGKMTDLKFGDGAGDDMAGKNGTSDEDGDGKGTAEDPSDYFNRIDKSASIFKVVSARYLKKKSLWVVPEKKI